MHRTLISLAAVAFAGTSTAGADTMYLIENQSDTLWAVDVGALEAQPVGPLGVDWTFGGLGVGLDGTLYGYNVGDGGLYTIDPSTGAATLVGVDLEPHGLDAFDIHPTTGQAIGLGVDSEVWEVDLSSGDATFLTAMDDNAGAGASAFAADGTLYSADRFLDRLLTVDPATGAVEEVGDMTLNFEGTSMGYRAADGLLYALRAFDDADLLSIDPETGTAALVGAVDGLPDGDVQYTAATFGPVAGEQIFLDGFEAGDTTAWSVTAE